MEAALQVTDLTKTYPGFQLDHVSFTLPQGAVMGLIGENGAGKSTTIKAILDLIGKDDGTVTFWGQKLSDSKHLKEDIGVVFDQGSFYETLTPTQIGNISAAAYTQWDQKVYDGYLARFQLPKDKPLKSFSKGMHTKLSIAVALSHHPKLLVLDEATSGLDPVVREDILDVFWEFVQDEHHSILMSSHITSDLEKIADYITYLHQGQVILSAQKDEILEQYGQVGCSAAQLSALEPELLTRVRRGEFGCHALVADRAAFQRVHPELPVEPVTLDDIMLFVGKGEAV